jgi:hypothetical protein
LEENQKAAELGFAFSQHSFGVRLAKVNVRETGFVLKNGTQRVGNCQRSEFDSRTKVYGGFSLTLKNRGGSRHRSGWWCFPQIRFCRPGRG